MGASRCARLNSVAQALRTALDNVLLKVIRSMSANSSLIARIPYAITIPAESSLRTLARTFD